MVADNGGWRGKDSAFVGLRRDSKGKWKGEVMDNVFDKVLAPPWGVFIRPAVPNVKTLRNLQILSVPKVSLGRIFSVPRCREARGGEIEAEAEAEAEADWEPAAGKD
jgi:hypothetical protein